MIAPVVIVPTWDGPAGTYDVVSAHDREDVWLTGTLDDCRSEYPGAPLVEDYTREPAVCAGTGDHAGQSIETCDECAPHGPWEA